MQPPFSPRKQRPLTWIDPSTPFPSIDSCWGVNDPINGLLCAGADLSVHRLIDAYSKGIFPWFSNSEPILWWSPDPRMVLELQNFKISRSYKQVLARFAAEPACKVTIDKAFKQVIHLCATAPRAKQRGTWILPQMQDAYLDLHLAGVAHSVEVWRGDSLIGGLYCVNVGGAVFGESMFSLEPNASKIALAWLVDICKRSGVTWIDCQQQTAHLASLGAAPAPRTTFMGMVHTALAKTPVDWQS